MYPGYHISGLQGETGASDPFSGNIGRLYADVDIVAQPPSPCWGFLMSCWDAWILVILLIVIWLPVNAQQVVTQWLGFLPLMWDSCAGYLTHGFGLAHPLLWWELGRINYQMEDLFSLL